MIINYTIIRLTLNNIKMAIVVKAKFYKLNMIILKSDINFSNNIIFCFIKDIFICRE